MKAMHLIPLVPSLIPSCSQSWSPSMVMPHNFMPALIFFARASPLEHIQCFFIFLPGLLRGHSKENKRSPLWILCSVKKFQEINTHLKHSTNERQKPMDKHFSLLIRSWGEQSQESCRMFLQRTWRIESVKSKVCPLCDYPIWFFQLPWFPISASWNLMPNKV